MKSKFKLFIFIIMAIILPFVLFDKAHTAEISDSGTYTLILNSNGGKIDGVEDPKSIKFNFVGDEKSVSISNLIGGIIVEPPTGKELKYWYSDMANKKEVSEIIKADIEGSKLCTVYALYENKQENSEEYSITFNPCGGKFVSTGSEAPFTTSKKLSEWKKTNLNDYKVTRDGFIFCGWGYNCKVLSSINSSCFPNGVTKITALALYKNNGGITEGNSFILDANGGKIDGNATEKCYYDDKYPNAIYNNGMPIFHYVPVRTGYSFEGWNTKSDGTGSDYQYLRAEYWNESSGSFEIDNGSLKLYAQWKKEAGGNIDENNYIEINSAEDSEFKGSVIFEEPRDKYYKLDIKKMEIPEGLTDKNVKLVVDINLINGDFEIVEINGIKMRIKIALPEELKGYNQYEIVYIGRDNGIKETLPATVKDGYITFETTHLSKYGIVATNNSSEGQDGLNQDENLSDLNGDILELDGNDLSDQNVDEDALAQQEATENPSTGDAIGLYGVLLSISSAAMSAFSILNRKKVK